MTILLKAALFVAAIILGAALFMVVWAIWSYIKFAAQLRKDKDGEQFNH